MSETQQSVMGPRRLFILLALGAVVFYVLSTLNETEDSEDEKIELTNSVDEDIQDDTINDIDTNINSIISLGDETIKVSSSIPQTSVDYEYTPQSNTRKEYVPNRNYDYNPQ